METFIRKQLRLKAHKVTGVEVSDDQVVVEIDRLGSRLLRCGLCRRRCRKTHGRRGQTRTWKDLSLRGVAMVLRYRPWRVCCPRCGVWVEGFP